MVVKNQRKSLIQHCEQSELRLHFIKNAKNSQFGEFLKNVTCWVIFKQCVNFAEKAQTLEVRTSDQKLTLEGLACYQNYSIQVVAATKMGDGLKSRSVYCRTKEDCKLLLHYCII